MQCKTFVKDKNKNRNENENKNKNKNKNKNENKNKKNNSPIFYFLVWYFADVSDASDGSFSFPSVVDHRVALISAKGFVLVEI